MRRILLFAFALGPLTLLAAEPKVDYLREVKPILQERCYACHGALQKKNDLRLDTADLLKKGGAGGPAIEPGKSADSLLILAVTGAEGTPKMPPEGEGTALTAEQITILKRWIDQGAVSPSEKIPEDPRRHWAFQKPVRAPLPHVKHPEWVTNPVDNFLVAEWERHGLTPVPLADKGVLLRRVYLDLIGLPPTRDELHAFLADASPDAYEKVVDRLLASPQYAERWGRHWMDVWRYSDWYGRREINEHRNARRHAWRWRDWIVESIGADKGYDQMLREMLAADELEPGNLEAQRATGFLGRNYYMFNRHVWLQDTVEHVGMGFLGLTFKCCRCHDHKYDPLAQAEYFQLRNVFEPYKVRADRIPGHPEEFSTGKPQVAEMAAPGVMLKVGYDYVYDADPQAVTHLLRRGNEKDPDPNRPMAATVPAVLGGSLHVKPVELPPDAYYPALRAGMREELLRDARQEIEAAQTVLRAAQKTTTPVTPGKTVATAPQVTVVDQRTTTGGARKETLADTARTSTSDNGVSLTRLKLRVEAAESKLESLQARIAADLAKFGPSRDSQFAALAAKASRIERTANLKIARADLAVAEHGYAEAKSEIKPVVASTLKKFVAAEKVRNAAQAKFAAAEKALQDKSDSYSSLGPVYPQVSSGRRLAFANWLTSPTHPLTARVAVNHIWARHFGVGIVPTTHNFGLNGKRPSHPDLLDWLAMELSTPSTGADATSSGSWRMKRIHRLIVTSQTYRRSSEEAGAGERNLQVDPENKYLWRMNPRRMEAEVVRDSLLKMAGSLDLTRGGTDIDPAQADSVPRRSLYFTICPDVRALMLEQFDAANPIECYVRTESIIPQQALALANGSLCQAGARTMARDLSRIDARSSSAGTATVSDDQFVNRMYELILCRPPSAAERGSCLAFLKRQPALFAQRNKLTPFAGGTSAAIKPSDDPLVRARENLVHVLLNTSEFITVR